jgi:hypothetical protein
MAKPRALSILPTDVKTERDGKIYSGYYSVMNGVISVHYGAATKAMHLGGSDAQGLARTLLAELLGEASQKR